MTSKTTIDDTALRRASLSGGGLVGPMPLDDLVHLVLDTCATRFADADATFPCPKGRRAYADPVEADVIDLVTRQVAETMGLSGDVVVAEAARILEDDFEADHATGATPASVVKPTKTSTTPHPFDRGAGFVQNSFADEIRKGAGAAKSAEGSNARDR